MYAFAQDSEKGKRPTVVPYYMSPGGTWLAMAFV